MNVINFYADVDGVFHINSKVVPVGSIIAEELSGDEIRIEWANAGRDNISRNPIYEGPISNVLDASNSAYSDFATFVSTNKAMFL